MPESEVQAEEPDIVNKPSDSGAHSPAHSPAHSSTLGDNDEGTAKSRRGYHDCRSLAEGPPGGSEIHHCEGAEAMLPRLLPGNNLLP